MITVDTSKFVPIYQQIKSQIKKHVVLGTLKPHQMLSSIRDLATDLLINPNTVARAYRELEMEGFIYTRKGKGCFVSVLSTAIIEEERADSINQGLATEIADALTKVAFEINQAKRVEIHCDPDNIRSARVPEKLGFVHEATLRNREEMPNGKPRDTMIWTMLDEEYPTSKIKDSNIEAFDAVGRKIL